MAGLPQTGFGGALEHGPRGYRAVVSEIGPGFSLDIQNRYDMGFSPRDMLFA